NTTLFKTKSITGLTPGKTYHYRAKAVNSSGTTYGSDRVFAAGSSFSKSSHGLHTITVGDDGIVYAFGYNGDGILGDNTTTERKIPIKVLKGAYSGTTYLGDNANNPIISVAGYYHSIALAADGSVYAFGHNGHGELGDNTTTNRATPIQVLKGAYSGTTYLGDNANNPIISVSAGGMHNIALAADGSVYAFGWNNYGQLGDNTTTNRATPIQVLKGAYSGTTYLGDNANNPIISVAAGWYHNIALAADGSVYTFGYNAQGQLGDNTTTNRATPIKVLKGAYSGTTYLGDNANNPIISLVAGDYHSIALAADGSVYAFGWNGDGPLGDNTTTDRATPIKVLKGAYSGTTYLGDNANNPIISVAGGDYYSIALAADGSVYAFGNNRHGQLGDNTTTNRATPINVLKGAYSGTTYLGDNANNPIISVAAGAYHSIALAADGSVYTFGRNANGQLGDNTTTNRATPIQVLGVGGTGYLDLIGKDIGFKEVVESNISIYPNPTTGDLNIAISNEARINAISLTDLNGKSIITFNPSQRNINFSELAMGMYFLQLQTETGLKVFKVVKL
ncbi:MAG: T9SS type A sorting domain-containing protein, partial [Flavobacteriaceae bacterium]|nr:T9SS type A sorting domain-containing protein [Flavobacteriaceae bacterium]